MLLALVPLAGFAQTLNVKDYGAVGDGRTNDTAALTAALKAAQTTADRMVYVPAGVYRYDKTLVLDGIHLEGAGPGKTIFETLNSADSSLKLTGNGPELANIAIRPVTAPTKRDTTPWSGGVHVVDASHFLIDRVHIDKMASVGMMIRRSGGTESQPSVISNCVVTDTLADGIHMTNGSHYINVLNNKVDGVGDDLIAVVSYRSNSAGITHHINIADNEVSNQTWGRGITVVGGRDVRIVRNKIHRSSGAGVYIASEASYDTYGVFRVEVAHNVLTDCVTRTDNGHAGILIYGRESSSGNDNRVASILVANNTVRNPRWSGVTVRDYTAGITLADNALEGCGKVGFDLSSGIDKLTRQGNTVDGQLVDAASSLVFDSPVIGNLLPILEPVPEVPHVNAKDFGAVANDNNDDTNAIVTAMAAAKASGMSLVYVPAGVYRYNSTIVVDGVRIEGAGPEKTIFESTNSDDSSFRLGGNAPGLAKLAIRSLVAPTQRASTPWTSGVHVLEAQSFTLDSVHITGMASTGVIVRKSVGTAQQPARIANCVITGTLANGIHITDGTKHLVVKDNVLTRTGGDFVSIVSYRSNSDKCDHIDIVGNTGTEQTGGRGIAVSGGTDINIAGNRLTRTQAAAIYIASESSYDTYGVFRVTIDNNVLEECVSLSNGHSNILVFGRESSSGNDNRVCDVKISNNLIRNSTRDSISVRDYTGNITVTGNRVESTR